MGINAGLGIANFSFDDAKGFWRWVDLCDEGSVDSIWQSDRIIESSPNLETMSVMAALAGRTSKIKFGMNVASLGLRNPILMAKTCATIDFLSEGRLLPAFGIGSALSRDYTATGTETKGRGKRTDEGLQIMSRLWSEDHVSFNGEYYQLDDATISPKPIQTPLPLWVGGSSKQAIERTAKWGTGWQAGIESPAAITPVIQSIKERAGELNRTIPEDHFGAGFAFRFGSPKEKIVIQQKEVLSKRLKKDPSELIAVGNKDDIIELTHRFLDAGAQKFILRPIASGTKDMIEQTTRLITEVLPEISSLRQVH